MTLQVHRLARDEVRRAAAYYRRRGGSALASRLLVAIDEAFARLAVNPGLGAPSTAGCRVLKVKQFRYLVHYRASATGLVEVFAVGHTSRRPGYWLRRTRRP